MIGLIFIALIIIFFLCLDSSNTQQSKSSYKEFYRQNISDKKVDVDEQVDNTI